MTRTVLLAVAAALLALTAAYALDVQPAAATTTVPTAVPPETGMAAPVWSLVTGLAIGFVAGGSKFALSHIGGR